MRRLYSFSRKSVSRLASGLACAVWLPGLLAAGCQAAVPAATLWPTLPPATGETPFPVTETASAPLLLPPTPVIALSQGAAPETGAPPAPTPAPLGYAPVSRNADWAPVAQNIEGVEMLLVPAGCFQMGSDAANAGADEGPAHPICFAAPFWIDRLEVTAGQFGSPGSIADPGYPRDSVSWGEAAAHCAARGARLPTEAEWEYAARGPDGLIYPWGGAFDPAFAVYAGSGGLQPAASRPEGASWVGALDMAGSLWEWTSTIYDPDRFPYPYDPADGREDPTDRVSQRVIRGGSWDNEPQFLRAAGRRGKLPSGEWYGYIGFRCVRGAGRP